MLEKFKKYNSNYLILSGAVIFCCTMLLYTFVSIYFEKELGSLSRFDSFNNYFVFVFSALIIAPIFEEFTFRGYFANNLLFRTVSVIGMIIYIYSTDNLYLYILLIILFGLNFVKNVDNKFSFIISSIIFSLVHYKTQDFSSIITIIPMFFQLSLGLILIWVVLNFNLFKSIIIHFLFNIFFIILFTIPLQFPKGENKKVSYLGYTIEWSKTPIFSYKNTLISRPSEYEVIAENVDIEKFYNAFDSNSITINNDNKFFKFKIKINRVDSTANKLDSKTLKKLLEKANLTENK